MFTRHDNFIKKRRIGARCGAAAGVDGDDIMARFVNQPEAVAADAVHVRINHRDGGCRGDHCFECSAALAQYRESGLRGQRMRCDHHAAGGESGFGCHGRFADR